MTIRASRDILKNTELTIGYIAAYENVADRANAFEPYGFECHCSQCQCQRKTSSKQSTRILSNTMNTSRRSKADLWIRYVEDLNFKRLTILEEMEGEFNKEASINIAKYKSYLDKLNTTYPFPETQEPRRAFNFPCFNLIKGCTEHFLHADVVDLGLRFLKAMGFVLNVTAKKFEVKTWGVTTDELVASVAHMWRAYGVVEPRVVRDVETVLKTMYRIVVGEETSFGEVYGEFEPTVRQGGSEGQRSVVGEIGGKGQEDGKEEEEDPELIELAEEVKGKMTMMMMGNEKAEGE